jgi:hypothetical protein
MSWDHAGYAFAALLAAAMSFMELGLEEHPENGLKSTVNSPWLVGFCVVNGLLALAAYYFFESFLEITFKPAVSQSYIAFHPIIQGGIVAATYHVFWKSRVIDLPFIEAGPAAVYLRLRGLVQKYHGNHVRSLSSSVLTDLRKAGASTYVFVLTARYVFGEDGGNLNRTLHGNLLQEMPSYDLEPWIFQKIVRCLGSVEAAKRQVLNTMGYAEKTPQSIDRLKAEYPYLQD